MTNAYNNNIYGSGVSSKAVIPELKIKALQADLAWSTDEYAPQHRLDAWYQMLCESHLP